MFCNHNSTSIEIIWKSQDNDRNRVFYSFIQCFWSLLIVRFCRIESKEVECPILWRIKRTESSPT